MKTKTIYISDDGTEFTNELMCLGYEAKIKGNENTKRNIVFIAENAFLICAGLLGLTYEDFIMRSENDNWDDWADCDPVDELHDWIFKKATEFADIWIENECYKNNYDYETAIFEFARDIPVFQTDDMKAHKVISI